MSTKTTKRKRASTAAKETSAQLSEPAAATPVAAASMLDPAAMSVQRAEPTVALSSHCIVRDAAGLKTELLQMLEESASVVIDAKSVERVDTATMQLLCAFVRDRAERNLGVTWRDTPQALREAARLLGVGALLTLPAEAVQ